MQAMRRGQLSCKEGAERDAAAAKMQSLTRGRNSRKSMSPSKRVDRAPPGLPPPAATEDEREAATKMQAMRRPTPDPYPYP
eukprot:scaffold71695_cov31-Phaeocystis_antarctica.AAC.1